MIKKIILRFVVLSISAGLIYGGVYRTIARVDTGGKENQSEKIYHSMTRGTSRKEIYHPFRKAQGKEARGKGMAALMTSVGSKEEGINRRVIMMILARN